MQQGLSREERERLHEMAHLLEPDGIPHLRTALTSGASAQAVATVALLSWLYAGTIEKLLPARCAAGSM